MGFQRSALCALAAIGLVACSDAETPIPGQACVRNSDCNDPLVCSYGICHEECRDSDDCPSGQRCVWASGTSQTAIAAGNGVRVCLLPEQATCALDSQCTPDLVCGRDLQCRNECEADRDCPDDDDRCLVAGQGGEKLCVEPEAMLDGGVGDASLDGGFELDGNVDGGAFDATLDGSLDASSDAGPREVAEVEPNDSAGFANPYLTGTKVMGCICSDDDDDWYTFTVPEGDTAGGYFRVAIRDVGDGAIFAYLSTASDQGRFASYQSIVRGEGHQFYFAGAAGQTYRLEVVQAGVNPFTPFDYALSAEYVAIDDPFEPNNTRDEPSPVILDASIEPFFYAGYESKTLPFDAYDDWFSVTLAAGATTVDLDDVPASLRLRFRVYDESFIEQSVSNGAAGNLGAEVHGSFNATAPGMYRVVVQPVIPVTGPSGEGSPPEHFSRPYRFTIGQ